MTVRDYNNMLRDSAKGLSRQYSSNTVAWRHSMAFWLNYYRKTLPR